jgi:hypothetical protein
LDIDPKELRKGYLRMLPDEQRELLRLYFPNEPDKREQLRSLLDPTPDEIAAAEDKARKGDCAELIKFMWPGICLDGFQLVIINSVLSPYRTETLVKGCTRPGKGFSMSVAVCLWFHLFEKSKVVLTGPSHEHIKHNLFAEIAMLFRQMKYKCPGECRTDSIVDLEREDHYIVVSSPRDGEGFSGQHGPKTLFAIDEATIFPEALYLDARKQAAHIIALANPRCLSGWFRDAFPKVDPDVTQVIDTSFGNRQLVTVGGLDCANVIEGRLERPIGPKDGITIDGREFKQGEPIPPEYFKKVKLLIPNQLDLGRFRDIMANADPRHRDVFALGKFPTEDALKQIVLASWLDRHREAWKLTEDASHIDVTAFGLDLGASETGDASVLAVGGEKGCKKLYSNKDADTMKTVHWAIQTASANGIDLGAGRNPICVDADTWGKGVSDRLRELGCWVLEFHGQKTADEPRLYENARSEAWGEFGQRLDPNGPWGAEKEAAFGIPPDRELVEELTVVEKVYGRDPFRFGLTPKDRTRAKKDGDQETIRDKIGRSPDRADAVVYLWRAISLITERKVPRVTKSLVVDLEAMKRPWEQEQALAAVAVEQVPMTQAEQKLENEWQRFTRLWKTPRYDLPPDKDWDGHEWS